MTDFYREALFRVRGGESAATAKWGSVRFGDSKLSEALESSRVTPFYFQGFPFFQSSQFYLRDLARMYNQMMSFDKIYLIVYLIPDYMRQEIL